MTGTTFLPPIRAGQVYRRSGETRAAPVPRVGVKRPPPWIGVGRDGREGYPPYPNNSWHSSSASISLSTSDRVL